MRLVTVSTPATPCSERVSAATPAREAGVKIPRGSPGSASRATTASWVPPKRSLSRLLSRTTGSSCGR